METALYYTLSTIAQTLAGALAILVAVALFKLVALNKLIDDAKAMLRSYSLNPATYWPVLRDQGLDTMADLAKEKNQGMEVVRNTPDLLRVCPPAQAAYQEWSGINRRLRAALGFSIADIALCFFLLPFAQVLRHHRLLAIFLLAVAVVLGVVCLGLYWRLIGPMVKRPDD